MGNGILEGYDFETNYVVPLGRDVASGLHVQFSLEMANRHGGIFGATGTGKTRTVQQLAEWFSQNGVSVLVADGKGDMSGMARPGELSGKSLSRARKLSQFDCEGEWWVPTDLPVEFLALGGNGIGIPVRVPIGSFGHRQLAKLCTLSPAQTLALSSAFLAARNGKPEDLETVSDLAAYLRGVRDDPDSGVSEAVCNRILNRMEVLNAENPGLFGGPEFDVMDLIDVEEDSGFGRVSIIDSSELMDSPEVLTTFLLSIMEKLANQLPEVGDGVPKLAIFLDEAHLIFEDAPKEFVKGIVRTIRRLRSKGVGVYFCTQSSADIPSAVLQQCANRIQHAMRANTPEELSKLRRTVQTFPVSKVYDVDTEIRSMGTGVALVCLIDDDGIPTPPSVCEMYVPRTSMEPMEEYEVLAYVGASELGKKYKRLDREHAARKAQARMIPAPLVLTRGEALQDAPALDPVRDIMGSLFGRQASSQSVPERAPAPVTVPAPAAPSDDEYDEDGYGTDADPWA